jgi:Concanavalin A-like lectin/glucanases superfamily
MTLLPSAVVHSATSPLEALDATNASALARAQGMRVRISSLETDSSSTYADPAGTFTLEETAQPTKVQRAGGWVPLDTSLVVQPDGSLATAATPATLILSGGGSSDLVTFTSGGHSLRYGWQGVLPKPTINGSTATYANVGPNEDLKVTASALGFETLLVIKARPTQPLGALHFPMSTIGETARQSADAALSFADPAGNEVASADQPQAWDSRVDPASGEGHRVSVGSSLVTTAAGPELKLDPLDTFLADPSTVYPVTVDPAATLSRSAFTYVDSAFPAQTYYNNAVSVGEHVGTFNGGGSKNRAMFSFPSSSMIGKTILAAHLNTTLNYSWSCTATQVDAHYSNPWGAGVTWNTQPGLSGAFAAVSTAAGYSGTCPAKAVGFDVTSLAVAMTNASWSTYYFSLLAHNELDNFGWKKFANNPSVTITYDSTPGTPAGRSVTPCAFVCAAPVFTKSHTPTFTGTASDPDGGTLRYDFEAWAGHAAAPTVRVAAGSSAFIASGTGAAWASPALADGDYEYRVRAFDGTLFGPWSVGWVTFTIDTISPAAPTVTATGPLSMIKDSFAGVVGKDLETATVTPVALDHAWGYIYGMFPGASPVFPTNPTCNTQASGFTVVCPGATGGVGASFTVQVAAIDDVSTFAVESFDAAGNVPGAPTTQTFYANADTGPAGSPQSGHGWSTTGDLFTHLCADPVVDNPGSAATKADLALSGGVCWGTSTVPGAFGTGVLSFDGTTATAATAATALADTSKSFTVSAWLNPAAVTGPGVAQTALAQDGTNESSFFLQNSQGHWAFCMPNANLLTYAGDCVKTTSAAVANAWTFVTAIWDAPNQQMRLYVSSDGGPSTPVIGSHAAAWASTGFLFVGRDKIGTSLRYWNGMIADPMVFPGVADSVQIAKMGTSHIAPAGL